MARNWIRNLFGRNNPIVRRAPTARLDFGRARLEQRLTPAFNLTLPNGGVTSGVSIDTVSIPGTTIYTATASGAVVASGDIDTQLTAGKNVIIDSGSTGTEAGDINRTGLIEYKNAAGTTLTLRTGSGLNLVGNISINVIAALNPSFSVVAMANNNITVNTAIAKSSLGQLTSISFTAKNGTINGPGFLQAINVELSTGAGIGSSSSPILTTATNLEAKTTTGGIFISNGGNLTIGGVSGSLSGVQSGSGPVSISTASDMIVLEPVSSGTSVSLTAASASGRLVIANTVTAPTITLTADRMVLGAQVYTASLNGANEVPPNASPATGSARLFIGADGAEATLDESWGNLQGNSTAVHVHLGVPGGPNLGTIYNASGVPAATGGSIPQQSFNLTPANLASLQAGNFYTNIHSTVFPGGEIRGQFGLVSGGSTAITASSVLTLLNFSNGRNIDLGSMKDGGTALELSDAELDTITTGVLQIGGAGSGTLTITAGLNFANVSVLTATNMFVLAPVSSSTSVSLTAASAGGRLVIANTVTAPTITLTADRMVLGAQVYAASLNGANEVPPNASPATGSAGLLIGADGAEATLDESWVNLSGNATAVHVHLGVPGGPNLGTVHNASGVPGGTSGSIPQQSFNLTPANLASLQAGNFYTNIHTNAFPGGEIRGQFGLVSGASTAITASSVLTLANFSNGRTIDLGSMKDGGAGLELSDAELDTINAATLRIGSASAGAITITSAISPTTVTTMSLITGDGVVDGNNVGTDVTVANLAIQALTGIGDAAGALGAIEVNATNVAFVNSTSGFVQINDTAGGLTIAPVDTITTLSSSAAGGQIGASSPLTIAMNVTVGASFAFTASGNSAAASDDLTIDNATVTLDSASDATLSFNAGDDIAFKGTGNIATIGGGTHSVIVFANTEFDIVTDADGGTVTQNTAGTVSVASNNLQVIALKGIGSLAIPLFISVDDLGASSNDGSSYLREEDGVAIQVSAGGVGSDLEVTADLGDIVVNGASATDTVTLTAISGSILDDDSDATSIVGFVVSLTADRAIGQPGATSEIDLTASFLSALTTNAGPFVGLPAPGIWVTQTGGAIILSSVVTAGDGDIWIEGDGGLNAQFVEANGAARTIHLKSQGDLELNIVTTTAADGAIDATSTNGNVITSAVNAGTGSVSITATIGSISDNNGFGVTNVTGGAISLVANSAQGINADVFTTTPATAGLKAKTSNDAMFIRGESGTQLQIDNVDSGTANVSITANNGSLTSLAPNDLVADVTGGSVTLNANGVGTIGAAGPLMFEVNATTLSASTDNQNIWLTDVAGGVGINSINASAATVSLQSNAGDMFSSVNNGVADVVGGTVILRGSNNGSFGAGNMLEINATTLNALTSGNGSINVRDTQGGLTVERAETANANIVLETTGTGANLDLTEVTATGGNITVRAADDLNIGAASTITATGSIIASVDDVDSDPAVGGTANISGTISATSMSITGNGGDDVFNITPSVTTPISINGANPQPNAVPGDTLNVGLTGTTSPLLNATLGATGYTGEYTFANRETVSFARIEGLAPSGPDLSITADDGATVEVPGTNVIYTVVVTNNGPLDVIGAVVTSTASAFLSGLTWGRTFAGGASGGAITGVGEINDTVDMPIGSTVTYTFSGLIASSAFGTLDSVFDVTVPADQIDPDPTNNQATDSDTLTPQADLSVTITDSPDPVQPGKNITYTITVTNNGPSDAQTINLGDILPTQTTYVSLVAPVGWVSFVVPPGTNGPVSASRSTLTPADGPQVFTLVVRVNTNTPNNTVISNTATVSSTTADTDSKNNSATASTTVRGAPLPLVVGADAGGGPHVVVYDPVTGELKFSFYAYDASFTGGVRVAAGDVTGDGIPDILTAAGKNGGPHVKVFDGITGAVVRSFFAYDGSFNGGVFIAAGDVNNDGFADIITGADAGGGPHVKVFDGKTGAEIRSFYAYEASFTGGVRVAAGDVNGDLRADVITGAGPGGGPHVEAFSGADGSLLRSFFAFDASFKGGVYVAAGDLNNDNKADITVGAGAGGGSHVNVFDGATLATLSSFFAYGDFTGGVRVGIADVNADGQLDLLTGAGPGGGPHVKAFSGAGQSLLKSFYAYDPSFMGGVFVG